ncbi:MAG: AAA family ATPase [Bacteroidota bacterium]
MIIAITGASGVGKTTILKELSKKIARAKNLSIFHFDDMDLPNWDELEDVKKWQEEATMEWIDQLVETAKREKVHILFEGSTEIKFYIQGFAKNNYSDYEILLFDCDQETMKKRLIQRGQPELYHSNMIGWLQYLRKEAMERNVEIVKTDALTISAVGQRIIEKLNLD